MSRLIPVLLFAVLLLFSGCMDSKNESAASQTTRIVEAPLIENYPQSVNGDSISINVRTLPNAALYVAESKSAVADESGGAQLELSLPDTINTFVIRAKSNNVFSQSTTVVITKEALNNNGTTRLSLSYNMSDVTAQSPITNLALNVDTDKLLLGDLTSLEVIATLNDGSTLNVTDDVSWIVSNAAQLSIASGELQSVAEGIVLVQASYKEMLSKPVVLTLLKAINGHILPLMPDSILNNATLEGVDANNNGIRDDVERWVLESYASYGCIATEISLKGANLAQLITTQAQNTTDAKALFDQLMSKILNFQTDCEINEAGLIEAMGLLDSAFNAVQFNTVDRNKALALFKTLWEQNANNLSTQELLQQAQAYSQVLTQQLVDKGVSEQSAKALAQKVLAGLYGFMEKLGEDVTVGSSSSVSSAQSSSVAVSVSSSAQSSSSVSSVQQSSSSSVPFKPGSVDTPGYAIGVTLSNDGTLAYVADGGSGLQIIDVRNPEAPYILGSVDTPSSARDVTLSNDGTLAYVVGGRSGLQIIDVSNPEAPYMIGSVNTPEEAYGVTLSNDDTLAYVVGGTALGDTLEDAFGSLQIIDVSNPEAPYIIGSVNTLVHALGVTLSNNGTLAYVADLFRGLQIIDVRNPEAPYILGSVDTPDWTYDVTLSNDGTLAYVADDSSGGLQIIDVSNPETLVKLGSVKTLGYVSDVTLSNDGTLAYVADDSSGALQIIDVSNPAAPYILGSVNTPGYAEGVTFSNDGTVAYVADGGSGLQIIDVSGIKASDKAPWINSTTLKVEQAGSVGDIVGSLNIAYTGSSGITALALTGSGAEYFSITTDGTVTLAQPLDGSQKTYNLSALATNSVGSRESSVTIKVHSTPEFKDFQQTVHSMSIEGTLVGQIDMWMDSNETLSNIALTGEGAENFTIDTSGRIYVAPGASLHHFVTPEYHLGISATNAYGSNADAGKVTITVLAIASHVDTPNSARGVTLSNDGTVAYVADHYSGLQIIDVRNPEAPYIIGSVNTPGYAEGVTFSNDGTVAYVADGGSGLQIIDVSNPAAPYILGSVDTPSSANGVTLSNDGTLAYVADGYSGLQIIDVRNPEAPYIIGSVNTPGFSYGVTLSNDGTLAYVVGGGSGLQIIDVSNPEAPYMIGSVNTPEEAYGVTLSNDGTVAYVVGGTALWDMWVDPSSSLQIIDVSNPEAPYIIGSVNTLMHALGVTLSNNGTLAYVADHYSGLQIIDVSNPEAPYMIGSVNTPEEAYGVTLSNDGTVAYVADERSGLQIIDITGL